MYSELIGNYKRYRIKSLCGNKLTIDSPTNLIRQFKNNISELSSVIGQLFIPILTKVMPIINGVTIAIKNLMVAIAGLLGVKLNFNEFGDGASGIEEDIDGATDSIEAMAGAAEKTKKSLGHYDELNVIPSASASGGGGVGGGGTGIDLTEEILAATAEYQKAWDEAYDLMQSKSQEIAERITNAFKAGDYEGIGAYISNGITNALNSIPWESVYSAVSNFGTGLAEFFNGLITPELFAAIGKTIAGALNTAIYAALSFGQEFDFTNLGLSIASGINNFFATFDFAGLAQTLNVWADGIWTVITTALANINWSDVFNGIKEFLTTLELDTIAIGIGLFTISKIGAVSLAGGIIGFVGKEIGKLFGTLTADIPVLKIIKSGVESIGKLFSSNGLIGGALTGIQGLITAFTGLTVPIPLIVAGIGVLVVTIMDLWNTSETFRGAVTTAFEQVKTSLVGAFNKIKEAVLPLWEAIKNLASSFYEFYNNSSLKDIVALFASLAATIGGAIISTAIDMIGTAFSGLLTILTGAAEILTGVFDILTGLATLDFDKVGEGFATLGNGILTAIGGIVDTVFGIGEDIVLGLLEGIDSAISTIGSWFKEHFVDPVVEKVKNLFGINSPSTVFAEIGGYLIEGLQKGVEKTWKAFISTFENLLSDVYKTISETVENIAGAVGDKFTWIAETATDIWDGISEFLSETWDNIKKAVFQKVAELVNEIKDKYLKIKETSEQIWNNIKQTLTTVWNNIKTTALNVWNNIKTTLSNVVNTIRNNVTTAFNTIRNTVSTVFNNVYSTISNKINAAKDAIERAIERIKDIFDFQFEWPDLKLPHFSIEGEFSLNPPSVPDIDIDWYAQGGVFNSPSVIGVGERGAEAVMPLERNTGWIDDLADRIAIKMSQYGGASQQPIDVNVTIEGEMRNLLKAIKKENNAYRKQTGQSMI